MTKLKALIDNAQAQAEQHAKYCSELILKEGLAAGLAYCQQKGIEPPQCSLTADSINARMLRETATRMLGEIRWWKRRLGVKAGRDFEHRQLMEGKVTNIISDESLEYYLSKKRR